jgi:hypothetical protein
LDKIQPTPLSWNGPGGVDLQIPVGVEFISFILDLTLLYFIFQPASFPRRRFACKDGLADQLEFNASTGFARPADTQSKFLVVIR